MVICKKKILNITLIIFINFFFVASTYGVETFKKLEDKKVSYLDYFLLKFENTITQRSNALQRQSLPTRVQYSNLGITVNFIENKKKINIKIYAVMDKNRYKKKKYNPKISDCNQIRNLIFYNKHGYKFFTQKRDPNLSVKTMEDIFKNVFFENINFNEKEIKFLMDKIYIYVTILHPINKTEISCYGKINDYKLK